MVYFNMFLALIANIYKKKGKGKGLHQQQNTKLLYFVVITFKTFLCVLEQEIIFLFPLFYLLTCSKLTQENKNGHFKF